MALDPGSFDLREVFLRLREQMLAELNVGSFLRHSTAIGNSAERVWLDLFERFLPGRYRASPAFVVDAAGNRSRQIDIVQNGDDGRGRARAQHFLQRPQRV